MVGIGCVSIQPFDYPHGGVRMPEKSLPSCLYCGPLCDVGYGYCHCGCGQITAVWSKTDKHANAIKGTPKKFIVGHTIKQNSSASIQKQIESRTVHGLRKRGNENPTYLSWAAMKARCLNPNNPAYCYYGGRGIRVCERWLQFDHFLADMGEKPNRSFTIERNNVNGNYEPGNCRWATKKEQRRNQRPRGPSRPKLPAWIDVHHRIPKPFQVVAVVLYGESTAAFFNPYVSPHWFICSENGYQSDNVTYWMPLADPPKTIALREGIDEESSPVARAK